ERGRRDAAWMDLLLVQKIEPDWPLALIRAADAYGGETRMPWPPRVKGDGRGSFEPPPRLLSGQLRAPPLPALLDPPPSASARGGRMGPAPLWGGGGESCIGPPPSASGREHPAWRVCWGASLRSWPRRKWRVLPLSQQALARGSAHLCKKSSAILRSRPSAR